MRPGARYQRGSSEFIVWAPLLESVALHILSGEQREILMAADKWGYWRISVDGLAPGTRYFYRLSDSVERPDPASDFQPEGVHGPSEVVDHGSFAWTDHAWDGIPLERMIIYELHVGAFTERGTLTSIIPRLDDLSQLGVNTIEIMPVAQFPGERNWGYDGAYPFSVQNSYGGPPAFKAFVDESHRRGLAIILDIVYNHLGPEGNYLADFAPYFTDRYQTPWGRAVNFDGAHSDGVRNYFIENALHWFDNYHVDALRLDAVHAIYDMSARPFLLELAEAIDRLSSQRGRRFYLIAESNQNDTRLIRPRALGGLGLDAQWCDDFHHSLRTLLTGETSGYYLDFGKVDHLAKALKEGFVYSGQYSAYRRRRHGSSSKDRPARQFVVFSQNHDQVGNRMLGERPPQLVSFEALKVAAAAVLFSPYVPLLFMGEEYGEASPFLYFVSHSDPELISAVREGRRAEFERFNWPGEPPDPQDPDTFLRSRLCWERRFEDRHAVLMRFYRRLIELRRSTPALANLDKEALEVETHEKALILRRWVADSQVCCILNFGEAAAGLRAHIPPGAWNKTLDSAEETWGGPGSELPRWIESGTSIQAPPLSAALFELKPR